MLPLIIASLLSVPTGWVDDPDHAALVQRDSEAHLPEGAKAQIKVESYRAPVAHGGQLLATLTLIEVTGDGGGFVRGRLDELKEQPDIGAAAGDKVRTVSWTETPDAAGKLIEGKLVWADDSIGMISVIRKVWVRPVHPAGQAEVIVELEGDCEIAQESEATLRGACEAALATLQLPPVDQRQPVTAPAAAAPTDDDEEVEAGSASDVAAQQPSITPATPGTAPTGPVIKTVPAPDDSTDMRPFYIGGALILLAAVLLWNRKKRAEMLEAEERAEEKAAQEKAAKKAATVEKKDERVEKAEKVAALEEKSDE